MNTKFSAEKSPIKLYRNPLSGHSHRVELMLSLLDLPCELINVDMANKAHKQPEYLAMNSLGQVPVIDDNGIVLADSNAIIVYLAKKYQTDYVWLSSDEVEAAQVQRWLSIAAGEIMYGPCSVRLVKLFGYQIDYDTAYQKTLALFTMLESLLSQQTFLVGDKATLADISAYSYIAHVPEGGVDLQPYPAIQAWLLKVEQLPRFVAMKKS